MIKRDLHSHNAKETGSRNPCMMVSVAWKVGYPPSALGVKRNVRVNISGCLIRLER